MKEILLECFSLNNPYRQSDFKHGTGIRDISHACVLAILQHGMDWIRAFNFLLSLNKKGITEKALYHWKEIVENNENIYR